MWDEFELFAGKHIECYSDLTNIWLCGKKDDKFRTVAAGILWGIWLTRIDFVFQCAQWQDLRTVLRKIWRCFREWKPMFAGDLAEYVDQWCSYLVDILKAPLAISAL